MDPDMNEEQSDDGTEAFGVAPEEQLNPAQAWVGQRAQNKTVYEQAIPSSDLWEESGSDEPPQADILSGTQTVDLNAAGAHEPAPRVGDQTAAGLADLLIEVESSRASISGLSLPDDSVVTPKQILTQDDFNLLKDWIAPYDDKVITLDQRVGIDFNASQYNQMGKISLEDRKRPGGIALGYLLRTGDFDLRAIFQGTNSAEFQLGWHKSVPHNAVAMVQAIWPMVGGGHSHVRPYSELDLSRAAPLGLPVVYAFVGAQGGFEVYKSGGYRSREEAKEVVKRRWLFFQEKQILAQEVPESFSVVRRLYSPTGEVLLEEDALMVRDDPRSFAGWSLQIGGERVNPGRIGDQRTEMLKKHYAQGQRSSAPASPYPEAKESSIPEDSGQDADGLDAVLGKEGEDAGKTRREDPTHKTTRRTMRAKKGATGQWELPDEALRLLDSQGIEGAQVMESPLQGRAEMPDIYVSPRKSPTPAQGINPTPVSPSAMGASSIDTLLERVHAPPNIIHERYVPDPEDPARPFKPMGQAFYKAGAYRLVADAGSETQALAREEVRKEQGFHKYVGRTGIFIKGKAKVRIFDVMQRMASDGTFAVNIVSDDTGHYVDVGEHASEENPDPRKGMVPTGTVIYFPSGLADSQEIVDEIKKDPLKFAHAYNKDGFPAWFREYAQQKEKQGIRDVFGDSGPHKQLTEQAKAPAVEVPPLPGHDITLSGPVRTVDESDLRSDVEVGEPVIITAIRRESSLVDHTTYTGTEFMRPSEVAAVHYDGAIIDGRFIKQYRLIDPLSPEFDSARQLILPDAIINESDAINFVMRRLNTHNNEYLLRFGDGVVWGAKPADDFEVRSWVDQRTGIIGVTYHSLSASRVPVAKVTSAKVLAPNDLLVAFKALPSGRQTDLLTATLLEDIFKDYAQS